MSIRVLTQGGYVTRITGFIFTVMVTLAVSTIISNQASFANSLSVKAEISGKSIYYTMQRSTQPESSSPGAHATTSVASSAVTGNPTAEKAHYVAPDGSDSNAGTHSHPFRTINRGIKALRASEKLYIMGGTYAERIDSNHLIVPAGTSWSNAPVIAAYPGHTVILKPDSGNEVINLTKPMIKYVIFDGLVIDGTNANYGIVLTKGTNHVRFQNGTVRNSMNGIQTTYGRGGTDFNEFINMKVHNNGRIIDGRPRGHGFYIATNNNLVDGCEIFANLRYGLQVYNGYVNQTANNNVIRNNRFYNNGQGRDGALTLNSGSNNTAYNNIIWSNFSGIRTASASKTIGTRIYNNTIYGNTTAGIEIQSGITNAVVQNNIVYANGSNSVNKDSTTVLSNNLTIDPKFVNAAESDFRLSSSSPAIDSGIDLSLEVPFDFDRVKRPRGPAYDIGAYEH